MEIGVRQVTKITRRRARKARREMLNTGGDK